MNRLIAVLLSLILGGMGLVYVGCGRSPAYGKLQVMYSGNFRGNVAPCGCKVRKGGIARWATFINRNQDPTANWLTVDAGNYVDRARQGGGCSNKCQFMVTSYEDLHYDVLNIAKQEVWLGHEALTALIDTSREGTEFVSANLLDKKTHRPLTNPYVIRDYGNMRVGVIGLLNEADFPETGNMLDTVHFEVMPHLEAARKYVPMVAGKSDVVVLLAELPTADLEVLLKEFPDVDLAISTGALRSGERPARIGSTQVLGTGSSGYNGHYALLELNPDWGDSIAFSQNQETLTDVFDEPGEWSDRLAEFQRKPKLQPTSSASSKRTVTQADRDPKPAGKDPSVKPADKSKLDNRVKPEAERKATTSNKAE